MATQVQSEYRRLLSLLGRAGLNAVFPNDFEYYLVGLELVDSQDRMIDYLVFPIMPDSITRNSVTVVNIKKTAGGVVALDTNNFIPIDFSIQGNFGRTLKTIVNKNVLDFNALKFSTQRGVFHKYQMDDSTPSPSTSVFNVAVKSGYGCTKVLQAMIDKSSALDENGKPLKLYFYNPTFNENYLIKIRDSKFYQNKDMNMIWQYAINFVAVAPLEMDTFRDRIENLSVDLIQRGLNTVIDRVRAII